MSSSTKQLYLFLSSCGGNWRNCIYIPTDGSGYLLTTNRDAEPMILSVDRFQALTGERIDPAECCGQFSEEAFKNLYTQYYTWKMQSAEDNPLSQS